MIHPNIDITRLDGWLCERRCQSRNCWREARLAFLFAWSKSILQYFRWYHLAEVEFDNIAISAAWAKSLCAEQPSFSFFFFRKKQAWSIESIDTVSFQVLNAHSCPSTRFLSKFTTILILLDNTTKTNHKIWIRLYSVLWKRYTRMKQKL